MERQVTRTAPALELNVGRDVCDQLAAGRVQAVHVGTVEAEIVDRDPAPGAVKRALVRLRLGLIRMRAGHVAGVLHDLRRGTKAAIVVQRHDADGAAAVARPYDEP